jgi:uncharacterized protein (TIGR03067 family)
MKSLVVAGVALVLLVGADKLVGQEAEEELAKLAGTWTLESRSSGGKEFKQAKALQLQVRIEGDKWTVLVKGRPTDTDRIVLDPTQDPKTIDRIAEKDGRTTTVRGIYKVEGDTLTVANGAANDKKRPEKFESAEGSSTILSVYTRAK